MLLDSKALKILNAGFVLTRRVNLTLLEKEESLLSSFSYLLKLIGRRTTTITTVTIR